jgi:acyl-CoA thioesterase-1
MNFFPQILKFFLITAFLFSAGCDQPKKVPVPTEDTSVQQPKFSGTLIAVGDSLTAGLGVAETEAWPFLLQNLLQEKGYNWQIINAGVSGETSTGALARIKWILAQKPDIVILETGANDGLRGIPVDVIEKNITQAIRMLQEQGTTVILAGMQIVQNLGPEYTKQFAEIYPVAAEQTGCLLIPFFLQDVAGEPMLNQEDTIHPNEKGHIVIADTVLPYVLEAIQQIK